MRIFQHSLFTALLLCIPGGVTRGDEDAVRTAITQYVAAFNSQEIQAVSEMWTEDATHVDRETGERTEGREAIVKDIESVLASRPGLRLSGQVDRVEMILPNVAKVEGQTVVGVAGETPEQSAFSAIVVQAEGGWKIRSIEEMAIAPPLTSYDALEVLATLEGNWVDESAEARVDTSVRWSPSNAFLIRSFVAQDQQGVSQQGTQVIGWDPRSQEIRSWTFNSDGSFGDAVWTQSGDDWLIKSSQTTAKGLAASGTYVMSQPDENTIELRLIGHEVEGEPQPSSAPVTMTRVSPATANIEAPPAAESATPVPADQGVNR